LALVLESLVQQAPDLVYLLGGDPLLLTRAQACAPMASAWSARLTSLVRQRDASAGANLEQTALCEQMARLLRALAIHQPLLVLIDDLQWADTPSLAMLFYLGRHLQSSRILIVGADRGDEQGLLRHAEPRPLTEIVGEFQRQWGDIQIDLAQSEGCRFVDAYLDSWPNRLQSSFRETLTRHTGGNALFTVELVRTMQERGDLVRDGQGRWVEGPNLAWGQLPPRVEGALSQRIGQLTSEQQYLLEAASVEGEHFHAEVLARVLGLSVGAVIAALSGPLGRQVQLVVPRGLIRVDGHELARYSFRHGMFQSYLYGRLDIISRAHLHGQVGAALEELYAGQAAQMASQLARHFKAAGLVGKAAGYFVKAGRQAMRVAAHITAISSYQKAIRLLESVPDLAERSQIEFAAQTNLDLSLQYVYGWGAPERLDANRRAYDLGRQMGWSTPAMLHALRRAVDVHAARGDYARAIELGHELLDAAKSINDPLHIAAAHVLLGRCHMLQGALLQAWEYVSRVAGPGLHLWQDSKTGPMHSLVMQVEVTACFVRLAMGYPRQAREHLERAITASDDSASPHDMAYAQNFAGMFYAVCHEDILAREWAEKALQTVESRDMPEMQTWGAEILGWAQAREGKTLQGIGQLLAAITAQRARGTESVRFGQEALLTEAYLASGAIEQARETIDEAIAQVQKTGTRFYEAELWRLRGKATLCDEKATADNIVREAETYLQRAIEIARQQGARLWELRATTSLAQLWAQGDRAIEAREAMASILGTLGEGIDTPDLIEARALLDELGP